MFCYEWLRVDVPRAPDLPRRTVSANNVSELCMLTHSTSHSLPI